MGAALRKLFRISSAVGGFSAFSLAEVSVFRSLCVARASREVEQPKTHRLANSKQEGLAVGSYGTESFASCSSFSSASI